MVLALAGLILFAAYANAGTIEGKSAFVNDQCETDKEFYNICADYDGTFNVNITGPAAGWVAAAPTKFTLNAGQCQELVLFVTPECYANSGVYDFNIEVSGAESFEKSVRLRVNQIHTQTLNVNPLTNTSRACESNYYDLTVTNNSIYRGEFILTTEGIPSSWVTLETNSFVLDPAESRDFTLTLTPNCSAEPTMKEFELKVASTLTNSSQSVFLTQNVVEFVPFVVEGLPTEVPACSETDETFDFNVVNVSNYSDEYNITFDGPDYAHINKSTITLDSNHVETITLSMDKSDVTMDDFNLSVYSQKYRRTFTVIGQINSRNCYDLSLARVDTEESECMGRFDEQYRIANNGLIDVNVTFESGYMTGQFTTEVASGAAKEVVIYMDSSELGRNLIDIKATTDFASARIDYNVDMLDCQSYDINTIAQIETDCNKGELFPIEITNTSVVTQTIDLNSSGAEFLDFSEASVTLDSNTSGILYMYVPPSCGKEAGIYNTILMFDNNKGLVKEKPIEVNLTEGCVPQRIVPDGTPMIKSATFDLNFYNDSNLPTEIYNITIAGFDYTSDFQPTTMEPFEEKIIHFELILPEGYSSKTADAEISVATSLGDKSYSKKVLVIEKPAPATGLFGLVEGVGLISLLLLLILIGLAIYALAPTGKREGKSKGEEKAKAKSAPKPKAKAKVNAKKAAGTTVAASKASTQKGAASKASAQKGAASKASAQKGAASKAKSTQNSSKTASKPKGKPVKKSAKGIQKSKASPKKVKKKK